MITLDEFKAEVVKGAAALEKLIGYAPDELKQEATDIASSLRDKANADVDGVIAKEAGIYLPPELAKFVVPALEQALVEAEEAAAKVPTIQGFLAAFKTSGEPAMPSADQVTQ